jgi:hypothetical protein
MRRTAEVLAAAQCRHGTNPARCCGVRCVSISLLLLMMMTAHTAVAASESSSAGAAAPETGFLGWLGSLMGNSPEPAPPLAGESTLSLEKLQAVCVSRLPPAEKSQCRTLAAEGGKAALVERLLSAKVEREVLGLKLIEGSFEERCVCSGPHGLREVQPD